MADRCTSSLRAGERGRRDCCSAAKRTLVTAESCTGGWIAKVITDIPGSSHWFECGFVTYSNDAQDAGPRRARKRRWTRTAP